MSRKPTQSDVARAAGVSRGLVSLALSGSTVVAPSTRERILAAARDLGYTRDLGAATLAAGRSSLLGVVLPDLRNPFFEAVVASLQAQATRDGLLPLIATACDDLDLETTIVQRLVELRVSGILMVSPVEPLDELGSVAHSVPLVLIGADATAPGIDVVHVDEDAAARLIVEHARAREWRTIIALSEKSGPGEIWVARRQQALVGAARARDVPVIVAEADEGEGVSRALGGLLHGQNRVERPLVATHNDLLALDVFSYARSIGLAPGVDVGIVGFDDTHLVRRPEFEITSVRQDADQLVGAALELLRESVESGERERVITPIMSTRNSS